MTRVLISGSGGMLARALQQSFERDFVLAIPREEMDITNLQDTLKTVHDFKPDIILNPAAFTRVDDNELFPEKSFLVNALGAGHMATAARQIGARLVHFSTDYIFDGKRKVPYREGDLPNPLSVYGASKLAGEKLVRKICSEHYIVRTSWLFGYKEGNFINYILQSLREEKFVRAAMDQVGSPTFVSDLAGAVKVLVEEPAYGTYHLTNSGFCSRYQLAREIARYNGCSEKMILPLKMDDLNLKARRPCYTVLDNRCWRDRGFHPLRDYHPALDDFLKR